MPAGSELWRDVERELGAAVELRHAVHADPELAHAEHRTVERVAARLEGAALERVAGTGLLATVPGELPAIALRAELDGLPIAEQTGAPFRARGTAMHACGHDVHLAALVAVVRAALRRPVRRALVAIFQPSEEAYPSGAREIVAAGALAPPPAAVLAAHVDPHLPWGAVGFGPGAVDAAADTLRIAVTGRGGHAAYPHRADDPVLAVAQVIVALHAAIGRLADPMRPAVLTVGAVHAGTAENVIPERAEALATLRTFDPGERSVLRRRLTEVVERTAAAYGCRASVEVVEGEPALLNDAGLVRAGAAALDAAGLDVVNPPRSCGADDFAFYGALAPIAMAYVGLRGAPGFEARPLHHPELLPPDAAVGAVARVQAALYEGVAKGIDAGPIRT
jgi:amidohydrolase